MYVFAQTHGMVVQGFVLFMVFVAGCCFTVCMASGDNMQVVCMKSKHAREQTPVLKYHAILRLPVPHVNMCAAHDQGYIYALEHHPIHVHS